MGTSTMDSSRNKIELFTADALFLSWHRQTAATKTPLNMTNSTFLSVIVFTVIVGFCVTFIVSLIALWFKLKRLNRGAHCC